MSFTNYAALQAYIVSDLFGRTDKTSEIQDAIRLAEIEMSTHLKVREMDAIETPLTISDGVGTVPTDLQSVHSVKLLVTPFCKLEYEPIEVIEDRRPDQGGVPQVYDVVGEQIIVWPPTSTTVALRYREDIPALTDSAVSNWVLAKYPHLYAYGGLGFIYKHLKDSKRTAENMGLFTAAIGSLNLRSKTVTIANMQMTPSVQVA